MPDHLTQAVLMVHAGATWFMVGLIWFVQVVHYPLMSVVSPDRFAGYALRHQRCTTWIVGPVMLAEASAACTLLVLGPGGWAWAGIVLLALVWASTFGVQVPIHQRLAHGFEPVLCRRLVLSNWVRTAAWSARGVVALVLLWGG